jgi:hypothetical protein
MLRARLELSFERSKWAPQWGRMNRMNRWGAGLPSFSTAILKLVCSARHEGRAPRPPGHPEGGV